VERWCEERGMTVGEVVPAERCFELARRWYAGRLERGWQRRSPEAMEATFRAVGLTSDFWRLSG
jgi:hypothetical protein